MDMALQLIVHDVFEYPLREVPEVVFGRLEDGTILSKIYDTCLFGTHTNILNIPPGLEPLEKLLTVAIIRTICSSKNHYYLTKLLQNIHPDTQSPITQLINGMNPYGQFNASDETHPVSPLRVSRQSSVSSDTDHTLSDEDRWLQLASSLSFDRFLAEDYLDRFPPSEMNDGEIHPRSEGLEGALGNPVAPMAVIGTMPGAGDMPRVNNSHVFSLTPQAVPAGTSIAINNAQGKRYPTTPHPNGGMHTGGPRSSPLMDRTEPKNPRKRKAGNPITTNAESNKSNPSRPSMLTQAPGEATGSEVPVALPRRAPDETPPMALRVRRSYKELAKHIDIQTGRNDPTVKFNIYRVNPTSTETILTRSIIKDSWQKGASIYYKIWLSRVFDDKRLRVQLGGGGKDFLDDLPNHLPTGERSLMGLVVKIDVKIEANDSSTNLWQFLQYCVLRVEAATIQGSPVLTSQAALDVGSRLSVYRTRVATLYDCLLGIFYRLGSIWDGRQLSLLNSLLSIGNETLLDYFRPTRRPIACDIFFHMLNACQIPSLGNVGPIKTLHDCLLYISQSHVGPAICDKDVVEALAGELHDLVDPKHSTEILEYYRGINICNEPPAKRLRVVSTANSGSSSGPSDTSPSATRSSNRLEACVGTFSYKVDHLAKQTDECGPIMPTHNQLYPSQCSGGSVRTLQLDASLDNDIIDTLCGLTGPHSGWAYLGSEFYRHLHESGYESTRRWARKLKPEGWWFFPVYEDTGSMVIYINWYSRHIEIYIPRCSNYDVTERREEYFKRTENWLKKVLNTKRSWSWKPIDGPQQGWEDSKYERDYIANFLCRRGERISSNFDLMACREYFLEVLSEAAKVQALSSHITDQN